MRTFQDLNLVRKLLKNWLYASIAVKSARYPVKVKDRNNRIYLVQNYNEFRNTLLKIKFGIELKLIDNSADFGATFFHEEYKFSKIKGKTVVDVGANVGDSSVYFAIQGASIIYAIEPIPDFFNVLVSNIKLNNFDGVIIPLNAALGNEDKLTKTDASADSGIGTEVTETTNGHPLRMITLSWIVKEFGIVDGKLKMDCEGCEYLSVIHESDETLRRFDEIILEFHKGHRTIQSKLGDAGFDVKVKNNLIYATRK